MSKDCRSDGRRRGAGQHRLGLGLDGREKTGKRVGPAGDGRDRSCSNSSGSSHGGGKGRNTPVGLCYKASIQRSNSHDKVRKIVAEEGRTARNLIAWSVPLETKEDDAGKSKSQSSGNTRSQRLTSGLHRNKKQIGSLDSKLGTAVLDKSPTKARLPRKIDLRARYWAFLFENLRRAVDEIYVTCESDQSVVECKEVLMMLDNYVRDFKALIDWIQLQEKLEKTDAQNRPTSLAWEVRKMSPGRHVMSSPSTDRINPTQSARKALNFGGPPPTLAVSRLTSTGSSWADKVKSTHTATVVNHTGSESTDTSGHNAPQGPQKPSKKDAEGWETVQRGRPARPRSATLVPKISVPQISVINKDDSDKENKQESQTEVNSNMAKLEFNTKDQIQFTDNLEDSAKSGKLPLQFIPQKSSAVTPEIHTDDVCPSIGQKVETAPVAFVTDQAPAETLKLESQLDPTELSNTQSIAEVLAKKEELADRLEKANEEAIASAIAEEEQLTREIQAEEDNEFNLETDNECDFSASIGSGSLSYCGLPMDWNEVLADYDAREPWRQSTSWGDIVEEEPARPPGHGIHMHEKLSSPSRKRTIAESKKKYEEKQLKAQQLREKLREEKTHKLQKLLEREKEVRKWKEELLDQRRRMMEEKLLHAEFKRELQLQAIVKKAQEEEAKVNEIAFINTLEAQNKRHDVLAKLKEYEQRLNELQEERQRRQEEKQARDEAVQERKRALEAERQARVEELLMKRKEQEARIEQQRQEKERAREDAARERARDREERLAALSAAQQEAMEELQKKIQLKHDESSRRHMEQIEQRKEKAAELSSGRHANTDYAPKLTPYERKKQCSLCTVLITSEVHLFSHIKGKKHQQAVRDSSSIQGRELSDEEVEHLSLKKYIVDIVTDSFVQVEPVKDGEEKQKSRKKAKKLRARMNSRGKEYETSQEAGNQILDSPYKAKLQRLVKDLLKQLQSQDSGQWTNNKVSSLDRTLGEISRILEKQNNADQVAFQVGGGLSALEQIFQVVTATSSPNAAPRIPLKSLCSAVNAYYLACSKCYSNCAYVLFGNKITFLVDLLIQQLMLFVPEEDKTLCGRSVNKQIFEGLATGLLQTTAEVLGFLLSRLPQGSNHHGTPRISTQEVKNKPSENEAFNCRVQDLISYVVNMGLIDKLYGCLLSIQGPIDENPKTAAFLHHATALLHGMCKMCFLGTGRSPNIFDNKRQDPTGLTSLLRSTDLVGVLHMLYCILLHGSTPDPNMASPIESYPETVVQVALQSVSFLNSFALLDLSAFQSVLGAEGLSLAFRHIISSLLWYCSHHTCEDLLHEVIICVGYFTVNHPDNQVIVQSGRQPSVLQKLCQLPFQYFSDPRLIRVLFPTLISACYNNSQNKVILEQEMSCVLLATFIQDFAQSSSQNENKPSQQGESVAQSMDYLELSNRFPRDQWDSALQFFLKKKDK
ncbi:S phase cyclin A-associated protein in the endoplasmic reticulum isoform X1 [Polypterus senegalus]|uniref:S phase cyclin A-associated protein in the endoplasmic reticulum isoform X1 n=1 Tax=Polypterus senegalus TaxID=55291 RepID=UPI0019665A8B|nr:S phase cyclin A-associated protein in the endoplasmic reticulum isoform X1 [Polypterus senegalus]